MSDQVSAPRPRPGRASLRHDGVIVFTPELVVQSWDPRLEQLFGIPVGDAIGRHITELLPTPDDRDRRFAELEARGAWRGTARLQGRRGLTTIDVASWALRSPDGGVAGYASTYRGTHDLNRPQIARKPSANFRHVQTTRTLQIPEDVAKSRAVSTTAETLYKQSVADRIREARTTKGISQGTLAMLIGKRRTHVNEWENAHHVPSWDSAGLIGSELGVTAEWLLTGRNGGPT